MKKKQSVGIYRRRRKKRTNCAHLIVLNCLFFHIVCRVNEGKNASYFFIYRNKHKNALLISNISL